MKFKTIIHYLIMSVLLALLFGMFLLTMSCNNRKELIQYSSYTLACSYPDNFDRNTSCEIPGTKILFSKYIILKNNQFLSYRNGDCVITYKLKN